MTTLALHVSSGRNSISSIPEQYRLEKPNFIRQWTEKKKRFKHSLGVVFTFKMVFYHLALLYHKCVSHK